MGALLTTLFSRLAALSRRRSLEADLDEELRSHLEMAVEVNRDRGMGEEEARRAARASFGGVEQTKELCRDERRIPLFETAIQDLRFSLRMMRRTPLFYA